MILAEIDLGKMGLRLIGLIPPDLFPFVVFGGLAVAVYLWGRAALSVIRQPVLHFAAVPREWAGLYLDAGWSGPAAMERKLAASPATAPLVENLLARHERNEMESPDAAPLFRLGWTTFGLGGHPPVVFAPAGEVAWREGEKGPGRKLELYIVTPWLAGAAQEKDPTLMPLDRAAEALREEGHRLKRRDVEQMTDGLASYHRGQPFELLARITDVKGEPS